MGISKEQSLQKHFINVRNMSTLFMLNGAVVLNGVNLYYEAKTFKEYADGIYAGSSLIVGATLFATTISDMRRTNECLDNIEKLVNKSRYHTHSWR